ncbi:MAG TPA: DUF3137 domain-containing protein [Saprospiraceae bacterium]|nr:DUF3137 domain-containing protein [Saprospiraceae bacterium]
MTAQNLEAFRIFYNHSIHPELMRMDRLRRRLLRLLFFSVLVLIAVFALSLYFDVLALTFAMLIPVGIYIVYLVYRAQKFRSTFKPHVVNLVLDFMDNDVNYGTLKYMPKKFIPKAVFLESKIFVTSADEYEGEDRIEGKIGELPFEMCELNVREFSKVRNRLNYVFRGVFLKSEFKQDQTGSLLILPREFRQYLSRSIKAFDLLGGRNVDASLPESEYRELFLTYATPDAPFRAILSPDMQKALTGYRQRTGKEIYISILEKNIYIAVTQPKDMLEPFLFQSNVSFDLVREFFEDVQLMIQIVAAFDEND